LQELYPQTEQLILEAISLPKLISESEREQVRQAIYQNTIALIRRNGVKGVTVESIAAAVGISKGLFYAYYPSKEIALYEALRRSEADLFSRMEAIMSQEINSKEQVERFLREVFLAPDSVILYLSPTDLEVLLRKLPPEYRARENKKSADYFQRSLELLKVEEDKMEAVALLTDCLGVIATNNMFSEKGKQQALDVLIDAISSYLSGEGSM